MNKNSDSERQSFTPFQNAPQNSLREKKREYTTQKPEYSASYSPPLKETPTFFEMEMEMELMAEDYPPKENATPSPEKRRRSGGPIPRSKGFESIEQLQATMPAEEPGSPVSFFGASRAKHKHTEKTLSLTGLLNNLWFGDTENNSP